MPQSPSDTSRVPYRPIVARAVAGLPIVTITVTLWRLYRGLRTMIVISEQAAGHDTPVPEGKYAIVHPSEGPGWFYSVRRAGRYVRGWKDEREEAVAEAGFWVERLRPEEAR